MYLVHARLLGPPGAPLPLDTLDLVNAGARPDDGLEHVAVHPAARPHPVIGLYVRADSLAAAEHRAFALCRRALKERAFGGWSLLNAQVPLLGAYYDAMLAAPGPGEDRNGHEEGGLDGRGQGPFGPPHTSSTRSDQRRK
ncbi:hypothetical protein [Streptomyces sp. NBC_00083]|uniref:hypothetical protein n=1 Tax=Streptomyces sp. NBC_00083 TaxID=2975647 RepID=UPI0022574C00|nr:hypothetical protein [Streptomyces sp. NBC_00083]MCX5382580.1 hypothetical protein [Streptomyces sp. NBC_00083]